MIFDSIPEYLKEQAKIYYGITEFPPEPNTCTWKLICGCRKNQKERSFLIQNGQHAAIYMVALDSSLDMMPFEESHFKRPDVQILFADIEEKLVFGRFDKFLYKLIPNIYLHDDDTEVSSFSAKVYINDDTKHLQREREKLAEIAKGKLVAASLDKDQTRNIVFPVFHIITSYMKHHLYKEYWISFWTTSHWFCQGEWLPNGLDIINFVKSHTLEQCYEWASHPERQYNDLWKSQVFHGVWRTWYWAIRGWSGNRASITIEARLKEVKLCIPQKISEGQFFRIETAGSYIEVRAGYVNNIMQGYNVRFNDFNYRDRNLNLYDNILNDLGLVEPPPLQEDENQEIPIETSLLATNSSSNSNEQPSNEQPSNEQPSNEQPSNEQPSNDWFGGGGEDD